MSKTYLKYLFKEYKWLIVLNIIVLFGFNYIQFIGDWNSYIMSQSMEEYYFSPNKMMLFSMILMNFINVMILNLPYKKIKSSLFLEGIPVSNKKKKMTEYLFGLLLFVVPVLVFEMLIFSKVNLGNGVAIYIQIISYYFICQILYYTILHVVSLKTYAPLTNILACILITALLMIIPFVLNQFFLTHISNYTNSIQYVFNLSANYLYFLSIGILSICKTWPYFTSVYYVVCLIYICFIIAGILWMNYLSQKYDLEKVSTNFIDKKLKNVFFILLCIVLVITLNTRAYTNSDLIFRNLIMILIACIPFYKTKSFKYVLEMCALVILIFGLKYAIYKTYGFGIDLLSTNSSLKIDEVSLFSEKEDKIERWSITGFEYEEDEDLRKIINSMEKEMFKNAYRKGVLLTPILHKNNLQFNVGYTYRVHGNYSYLFGYNFDALSHSKMKQYFKEMEKAGFGLQFETMKKSIKNGKAYYEVQEQKSGWKYLNRILK